MKTLRYFVDAYRNIENNAVARLISLYCAKESLDRLEKEYVEQHAKSPDHLVLADRTEPNQVKTWTSGDGSRIEVGCMTDQHLFYALAKARRGEYPDTHARATGIEALELEAFRRLRNKLTRQPLTMPRTRFCCDRCTGSQCHTPSCPTLSH